MPVRVVFFGNSASGYSNRYYEGFTRGACEIVAVVDSPPHQRGLTTAGVCDAQADFRSCARRSDVPIFEPVTPNRPEFVAALRALAPDLLVVVGYMGIFKSELLAVPGLLAVNFHASLLPAYRGKHPVFWALRHGERWSGLTVHVIDRGVDTGDILYQVRVRTRRNDTPADLYARILERSASLPAQLVHDAAHGRLQRRPQPAEGASYYSTVTESDFRLNWTWPAERLRRMVRVSPGQCFAQLVGQRLHCLDAEVVPGCTAARPGTLLQLRRTGAGLIQTGDDALRVHQVRIENAMDTSLAQVCRELGVTVGAVFDASS
jgi:methionyl-tRNA formyltransferase